MQKKQMKLTRHQTFRLKLILNNVFWNYIFKHPSLTRGKYQENVDNFLKEIIKPIGQPDLTDRQIIESDSVMILVCPLPTKTPEFKCTKDIEEGKASFPKEIIKNSSSNNLINECIKEWASEIKKENDDLDYYTSGCNKWLRTKNDIFTSISYYEEITRFVDLVPYRLTYGFSGAKEFLTEEQFNKRIKAISKFIQARQDKKKMTFCVESIWKELSLDKSEYTKTFTINIPKDQKQK